MVESKNVLRELKVSSKPWPMGFPSIEWRGWRLTPVTPAPSLDLSRGEFGEALRFCYPELGLSTLSRIAEQTGEEPSILAAYGLRPSERLSAVLRLLPRTPFDFQDWVDAKRLAPRDLFPLVALKDLSSFGGFLSKLAASSLSKSDGGQALEWAAELFLMDFDLGNLSGADWFQELRRLRRPMEAADVAARQSALREWPLPAQTSAQWHNGGDEPKLELRLQAKSPRDLTNKLKSLAAVSSAWEQWEKN